MNSISQITYKLNSQKYVRTYTQITMIWSHGTKKQANQKRLFHYLQ